MTSILDSLVATFKNSDFLTSLRSVVLRAIEKQDASVVDFNDSRRREILQQIKKVKNEKSMLLTTVEACQLWQCVEAVVNVEGDLAEVGCFQGASAKLIRCANANKPLHLFDTFEGLPNPSSNDNREQFYSGQFAALGSDVKDYLAEFADVFIYCGFFPNTAEPLSDKRFALVHLDVDLYQSTLDGIAFFYPRLSKGGVIVSHDYSTAPGVKRAFDEYFSNLQVPVIPLSGTQCLVVKVD